MMQINSKYNKYHAFMILPLKYKEKALVRIKTFEDQLGREPNEREVEKIIERVFAF